ncbi:MAG: uracil-DNA glycosylase, partial [Actinobacteria bacterium]|nr:uracil-DNA glycosylase [Actinomycetota bacterium]
MPSEFVSGVDPSWGPVFARATTSLDEIDKRLDNEELTGVRHAPAREDIFRAFCAPLDSIRVVILGQDPYPTRGHAVGLSFSTNRDVRPLPRSLTNIYAELRDDLGIDPAEHGDLSRWVDQGVMLLNTSLTVREGEAGSHRAWPWRNVTGAALRALAERGGPLVAVLWGREAQWAAALLNGVDSIESAHPS